MPEGSGRRACSGRRALSVANKSALARTHKSTSAHTRAANTNANTNTKYTSNSTRAAPHRSSMCHSTREAHHRAGAGWREVNGRCRSSAGPRRIVWCRRRRRHFTVSSRHLIMTQCNQSVPARAGARHRDTAKLVSTARISKHAAVGCDRVSKRPTWGPCRGHPARGSEGRNTHNRCTHRHIRVRTRGGARVGGGRPRAPCIRGPHARHKGDLPSASIDGGVARGAPTPRITPSSHTYTHMHITTMCPRRALLAACACRSARGLAPMARSRGQHTQTWVRHEAERHAPPRRVMGFTRSGAHTQTQDKVRGRGECTQPRGSPTRTHSTHQGHR